MPSVVTRSALAAASAMLLALYAAGGSLAAQRPPRIVDASNIAANRITPKSGDAYYSLSAVVRLSRALTASERAHFGLIASTWATRTHLAPGARLPDALFGGTSLGRVGRPSAHCYLAEVAQLAAHKTVKPGQSWRLALHNGHTVLRTAPRVILSKSTTATEAQQLSQAGCE
jgi:hypothetical protein